MAGQQHLGKALDLWRIAGDVRRKADGDQGLVHSLAAAGFQWLSIQLGSLTALGDEAFAAAKPFMVGVPAARPPEHTVCLLVIDQFEELFTQSDAGQRATLIGLLSALICSYFYAKFWETARKSPKLAMSLETLGDIKPKADDMAPRKKKTDDDDEDEEAAVAEEEEAPKKKKRARKKKG